MNGHLLMIALGVTALSPTEANDHVSMASSIDQISKVHSSVSSVNDHTSAIELSNQSLNPADNTKGLRIDYQPFDNNFSMSAGSFQNAYKYSQSAPYNNKTYLGVGWKKIVDQARLGLRVDIGAVYENDAGHSLVTHPVNTMKSISKSNVEETETARWQPVISLGVSYRF